jgi:hypothetical protein
VEVVLLLLQLVDARVLCFDRGRRVQHLVCCDFRLNKSQELKHFLQKGKSNQFTLIETRKSRDIQSDKDYEEKIPYICRLFVGTFVVPCFFFETKSLKKKTTKKIVFIQIPILQQNLDKQ